MKITQTITRPDTTVKFLGLANASFKKFVQGMKDLGVTIESTISEDELTLTQVITIPADKVGEYQQLAADNTAVSMKEQERRNKAGITVTIEVE